MPPAAPGLQRHRSGRSRPHARTLTRPSLVWASRALQPQLQPRQPDALRQRLAPRPPAPAGT
jgi:hypothetical protein